MPVIVDRAGLCARGQRVLFIPSEERVLNGEMAHGAHLKIARSRRTLEEGQRVGNQITEDAVAGTNWKAKMRNGEGAVRNKF